MVLNLLILLLGEDLEAYPEPGLIAVDLGAGVYLEAEVGVSQGDADQDRNLPGPGQLGPDLGLPKDPVLRDLSLRNPLPKDPVLRDLSLRNPLPRERNLRPKNLPQRRGLRVKVGPDPNLESNLLF